MNLGSRSICLYGASDSGKSANAGRFARYVYETTGRITRAVIADQGGSADVLRPYIEAGIVDPWYVVGLTDTITSLMHKLARGAWPVPKVGTNQLVLAEPTSETWQRVGAYIIDSGTGVVEQIKESVQSRGTVLSQKPSYLYEEDGEKLYGGNEAYYGFAQQEFERILRKFSSLPCRVLWTMGEGKGEDDANKDTVYGPETVGKAVRTTGKLPKKFGDLFHLETYPVVQASRDPLTGKPAAAPSIRRIYFVSHPDPRTGIVYPAKPRVPPELYPELLKRWSGGYLSPTVRDGDMHDGLDSILRVEDQLLASSVASVGTWKKELDAARQEGK